MMLSLYHAFGNAVNRAQRPFAQINVYSRRTHCFGTIPGPVAWHKKLLFNVHAIRSIVLILKHYVFVGRGHDPADQVALFVLVRFNESAFVSLRFGGVMTPPYE